MPRTLTRWLVEWWPEAEMVKLMDDDYDVAEASVEAMKSAGCTTEASAVALAKKVAKTDFYGSARIQKQLGTICRRPSDTHNCRAVYRNGQWIEWDDDGEVDEITAEPSS